MRLTEWLIARAAAKREKKNSKPTPPERAREWLARDKSLPKHERNSYKQQMEAHAILTDSLQDALQQLRARVHEQQAALKSYEGTIDGMPGIRTTQAQERLLRELGIPVRVMTPKPEPIKVETDGERMLREASERQVMRMRAEQSYAARVKQPQDILKTFHPGGHT